LDFVFPKIIDVHQELLKSNYLPFLEMIQMNEKENKNIDIY